MKSIKIHRFEIVKILKTQAVASGVERYIEIMKIVFNDDSFFTNSKFRKCFIKFYRVRRGKDWQLAFFHLMEKAMDEKLSFNEILQILYDSTGRVEASFSSKLYATLNPNAPVIDSEVLKALGLKLPAYHGNNRIQKISDIYQELSISFVDFLNTKNGKYLITTFHKIYKCDCVTDEKILDFVLWQKNRALKNIVNSSIESR